VTHQPSVTPEHFDRLYASDPDPWKFATSDYERDKYAATLAALPRPRYARAFEVGCSIGVLTRQLAARCDAIIAVDVAEAALQSAVARCRDLPGVQFARMVVPHDWPEGKFDLILFSEVLYYLTAADRLTAARLSLQNLLPGGTIVLVNWHGPTDGDCLGDDAADQFITACAPALRPILQQRAEKYRIDVLSAGKDAGRVGAI
jgi:SAM-dependent methyltransferase